MNSEVIEINEQDSETVFKDYILVIKEHDYGNNCKNLDVDQPNHVALLNAEEEVCDLVFNINQINKVIKVEPVIDIANYDLEKSN